MILSRPTTLGSRSLGRWTSSFSTPLRRTRTAMELSHGSIWMSDAPAFTASMMTQSTSRMMSMSSSEVQVWRNWIVWELMARIVYTGESATGSRFMNFQKRTYQTGVTEERLNHFRETFRRVLSGRMVSAWL